MEPTELHARASSALATASATPSRRSHESAPWGSSTARATQTSAGSLVIAPELGADVAARARFEHDWRATAALGHPNVVPIYCAGKDDGRLTW